MGCALPSPLWRAALADAPRSEVEVNPNAERVEVAAGGRDARVPVRVNVVGRHAGVGVEVPVQTDRDGVEDACLNQPAVHIDVVVAHADFPSAEAPGGVAGVAAHPVEIAHG